MVGVIHQLFFEFLERNLGPAARDEVKRRAGVAPGQEFRMDTVYPDDQWQRLLAAALEVGGLDAEQAELAFGRFCGEQLSKRMASFFEMCASTREFLRLQPRIHNMMASSVRDADMKQQIVDKFRLEEVDGEIVTRYASPNRHCTLYRGLAEWLAEHYGERIEIREPRCQKRGDPECEIRVREVGRR